MRALRTKAGWSARELEERCKAIGLSTLTRSTLAKIESGVREFLTLEELDVIARAFEVPIEKFLDMSSTAVGSATGPDDGFNEEKHHGATEAGSPQARTSQPVRSPGIKVFVGRARELKQLNDLVAAAAEQQPSVVLLGAEAGMGKSTLVQELAGSVPEGVRVLAGACIGLGEAEIPYAPLIEALRGLVRQVGEERARSLTGPAGSELLDMMADSTGPAILATPGAQARVFNAALRMLEHLCARAPVLLIFEDLHWADPSTLDLVAYLTRVKSNERLMLLCTYRSSLPRGHALRHLLAEPDFTRRVHRLSLSGFTRPEFREFAHWLVGELDPDRRMRLFDLSEGNPFFAELVLTARDTTRLPMSLSGLMLAQLEQLSEHAAAVTRVAAVAGRRVSDRLLAAVSEVDERLLDRAIRECVEAQILIAHPAEETYEFRHALLRETVYESLRGSEKRRMHAAMAQALAADDRADARAAMEMAHHWFQAGQHQREALASAVRAGELAARMRAFQEAERLYGNALALWPDVPDAEAIAGTTRLRVLTAAADAARWGGHAKPAIDWARAAIDALPADAEPVVAAELYERLGNYQWEAGSTVDSVKAFREAQQRLEDQPPSPVKSRVLAKLATVAMQDGKLTDGLRLARAALELARAVGARAEEGRALNSTGLALVMLDRPDEGVPLLRDAVRLAEENDHLEDLFRAYGNLGMALELSGDLRGAVDVLQDGLAQGRALGLLGSRQGGVLANNAGAAMFLLGRWDEAVRLLDEALEDRPVRSTVYMRLTRAQIDVAQGRWEDAERLLVDVRVHPNNDPRFIGPLYACMAEIAAGRGEPAEARAAIEHGLEAVSHGENALVRLQLCAVGLRVAADESLLPVGAQGDPAAARAFAERLMDRAREAAGASPVAEVALLLHQCEAEWARSENGDTAEMWAQIADDWAERDQPFPVAYARWRQAAGAARTGRRRQAAAEAARLAHAGAQQLAATPLLHEIEELAQRHRLDLAGPSDLPVVPEQPKPHANYKLTDREVQVLREVCEGRSNTEIARKLLISESTVGVHVTHLLKKLGVKGRTAAATLAHQDRFFTTR